MKNMSELYTGGEGGGGGTTGVERQAKRRGEEEECGDKGAHALVALQAKRTVKRRNGSARPRAKTKNMRQIRTTVAGSMFKTSERGNTPLGDQMAERGSMWAIWEGKRSVGQPLSGRKGMEMREHRAGSDMRREKG